MAVGLEHMPRYRNENRRLGKIFACPALPQVGTLGWPSMTSS